MRRVARAVAIVAAVLICVAAAVNWFLETRWRSGLIANGEARFLGATADAMERNVRTAIPLRSTSQFAEEALQQQGLRFSYDSQSRTLYTGARALKGSNWLVQSGISLRLHFDADDRLERIDSQVVNTGP